MMHKKPFMTKTSEFGCGSVSFKFNTPLQFCGAKEVTKFNSAFAHYTGEGEDKAVSEFWLSTTEGQLVCVFALDEYRAKWSDSVANFNALVEQIPFLGEYVKEALWKR